MEKVKVYFRVDGSVEIGLGHLIRCIALAQMLQSDFEISFFCKELPESIEHEIKKHGYGLLIIRNEGVFLSLLKSDILVVLDHYGLDSYYQKKIKDIGCKLICIDDLHDRLFHADLIINHAPNIDSSDYQAQVYTQYALGLDYVLLRPSFLSKALQPLVKKSIQNVFVCFGGADIKNITQSVLDILKVDVRFKKIIVITGAAYKYLDELKESIVNNKRVFLYHAIDSETMSNLIAESDLAIVPSSGILQEVLAVGCKVISGMYVENQKDIFNNYKALKAFESAGNFSDTNLLCAIDSSFKSDYLPSNRFIDGKSSGRLLNVFLQLVNEDLIILRNANEYDLAETFKWVSNVELRKFSFNNNPVEYDVHKKWFIDKINDENCFYYLGELNNNVFGFIRFDVSGNEAKISYLIDPDYQDKGLGTSLLKKGLDLFLRQLNKKKLVVWGEVFNENIASVKIFKKLGYVVELNPITNIIKFKKVFA